MPSRACSPRQPGVEPTASTTLTSVITLLTEQATLEFVMLVKSLPEATTALKRLQGLVNAVECDSVTL